MGSDKGNSSGTEFEEVIEKLRNILEAAVEKRNVSDHYKEAILKRHKKNYLYFQRKGGRLHDWFSIGFGKCLRAARHSKGWTLEELAERTDIPKGTIMALEGGIYLSDEIQRGWVESIAIALDEDVEVFLAVLGHDGFIDGVIDRDAILELLERLSHYQDMFLVMQEERDHLLQLLERRQSKEPIEPKANNTTKIFKRKRRNSSEEWGLDTLLK